jgi:hypothetical protein
MKLRTYCPAAPTTAIVLYSIVNGESSKQENSRSREEKTCKVTSSIKWRDAKHRAEENKFYIRVITHVFFQICQLYCRKVIAPSEKVTVPCISTWSAFLLRAFV